MRGIRAIAILLALVACAPEKYVRRRTKTGGIAHAQAVQLYPEFVDPALMRGWVPTWIDYRPPSSHGWLATDVLDQYGWLLISLLQHTARGLEHNYYAAHIRGDAKLVSYEDRFLNRTFEFRIGWRVYWNAIELRRALDRLPRRLALVWAKTSWSESRRRRFLFDLWDECGDDPPGLVARELILDFIHRALPARSAHAYPESELVELNFRRQSTEAFRPYD